jgi:hypothetical protein
MPSERKEFVPAEDAILQVTMLDEHCDAVLW